MTFNSLHRIEVNGQAIAFLHCSRIERTFYDGRATGIRLHRINYYTREEEDMEFF